jgi:hypothetical protein
MSIGKSVFDVIEHCSTEGDLPWSIDQGRQKRQYFRFSTRSSGEKLTILQSVRQYRLAYGFPPGREPVYHRTTISNSLAWNTIE